MDNKVRRPGSD